MPGTLVTEEVEPTTGGGGTGGDSGGNREGGSGGGGGEGSDNDSEGKRPQRTGIVGVRVALISIFVLFAALATIFIERRAFGKDWNTLVLPRILWLNTAILVASSITLISSRRNFLALDLKGFRHWWNVTTILGALFLIGQLIAWRQLVDAGVYLNTNPSSSFFYVFTAAHGLHLLGGVIALLAIAIQPAKRLLRSNATEIVAMYWHFMDGLWVLIFVLLYWGR